MTTTTSSPKSFADFKKLVDAEEFFIFFELPYDQTFVNVNRLHILKQFSLLIVEIDKAFPDLSEAEKLDKYKLALEEAYEVFKTSSPLETKLFKVFKDAPKNVVLTKDIGTES
jgi:nitrogenase-stabilizing/protective protein